MNYSQFKFGNRTKYHPQRRKMKLKFCQLDPKVKFTLLKCSHMKLIEKLKFMMIQSIVWWSMPTFFSQEDMTVQSSWLYFFIIKRVFRIVLNVDMPERPPRSSVTCIDDWRDRTFVKSLFRRGDTILGLPKVKDCEGTYLLMVRK